MKAYIHLVATLSALMLTACGESSSQTQGEQFAAPLPVTETEFNRKDLLAAVVDQVIVPTYRNFVTASQAQQQQLTLWCSALQSDSAESDTLHSDAKQSWHDAMAVWQQAELMQIGPLLDNNSNLRNRIYSWPNVSTCAVDQDVMASRQPGYAINTRTANRRGLDALEYLIFNPSLAQTCTVPGTEPAGWQQLSEPQKRQARCDFAQLVAADLSTSSEELLAAWEGETGFATVLKNAGQPDSPFTTAHEAVNRVSNAMFYIDTVTKDAKLATPLGMFANDCGLIPCAQNVESQHAQASLAHIQNNLLALQLLLQGGADAQQATGFDDFLVDVGDADTALTLEQELSAALQLLAEFDGTLAEALEHNSDDVRALHGQVKQITDAMKSDFINSLALELPATSAGDND